MRHVLIRSLAVAAVLASGSVFASAPSGAETAPATGSADPRDAAPIVLTGAQFADWSRLPAEGVANTYPSGATATGDGVREAHNGRLVVPADVRTGVDPDAIAAYAWNPRSGRFKEVPVQVDQRFPYFLANGRSSFSTYSGTDEELTYAWAPDKHSSGQEAWKKVFGECTARFATADEAAHLPSYASAIPAGSLDPGYTRSMADPVPTLDDDDEIALQSRDAGEQAPSTAPLPKGASGGHVVTVTDPLDPTTKRYLYLFLKTGGSSYDATTSPVQMTRDADADEWIDRYSFAPADPEKIGTSNTNYGPNLPGTVCRTAAGNDSKVPAVHDAVDGTPRPSTDRVPRDGMTVTTPTYTLHASGRWMVRSMQVRDADGYGPDLVSRWKGRAFQQSPDSSVSLVGFEDEQVNWEANSALLGWRAGAVRAIREIWGADSGTNVTKTETYYRDADTYAYHVRVHPIPSDGLYTSWDYNPDAVTTYYNLEKPGGVKIDGINDDTGSIDKMPISGQPAYFDAPDPTFDLPSAVDRPEEVAGPHGGLVYEFEFTGPTSLTNAAAVPYYRDDACLDDGTGDAVAPRPWPGEATTDQRVQDGYVAYWQQYAAAHGLGAGPATYADLKCNPGADPATTPPWQRTPFAAAFGQHGIHFFATHDSDNAFGPKPVDEIDGQQWRFAVPMSKPTNVVEAYGNNVSAKLVPVVQTYSGGIPTL